MTGSTSSADRPAPWHAQAGDLLSDDYNVPGIIACALAVIALACTLTAAGTGHTGWALVAGVAFLVLVTAGIGALLFEHRREQRIELAYGRTGHLPGHRAAVGYSGRPSLPPEAPGPV
ncbi:hypothetical protein ACWEVD_30715 [Nocardia thailandica]|uniref:UsfY protein n=1 Tax=Nocardia thailandica TaxID=257275 RepID=A0ABW6PMK8_9NOCA|nr:hypothetical protein [Nocardia thailandica]